MHPFMIGTLLAGFPAIAGTKLPRRNGQGPRRSADGELADQSPDDGPQKLGRR